MGKWTGLVMMFDDAAMDKTPVLSGCRREEALMVVRVVDLWRGVAAEVAAVVGVADGAYPAERYAPIAIDDVLSMVALA